MGRGPNRPPYEEMTVMGVQEYRWCSRCQNYLTADNFYEKRHNGYCKEHSRAYFREANRRPHMVQQRQAQDRLRNYGINVTTYAEMLVAQQGLCAACGKPELSFDRSGKIRPLSVDHDHTTGEIRALLCQACNAALGYLKDDPARIRALLAYAERF